MDIINASVGQADRFKSIAAAFAELGIVVEEADGRGITESLILSLNGKRIFLRAACNKVDGSWFEFERDPLLARELPNEKKAEL